MWLSDTQDICCIYAQAYQRFELVSHQSSQPSTVKSEELTNTPCFVHAHVYQGQLIGILTDRAGFTFHIYKSGSLFEEAGVFYPDMGTALNTAIERVNEDSRWKARF